MRTWRTSRAQLLAAVLCPALINATPGNHLVREDILSHSHNPDALGCGKPQVR